MGYPNARFIRNNSDFVYYNKGYVDILPLGP